MNDAEKAYQFFVIAVPENEEQAKAYFWARKALQTTLTPPNEWVSVEERLPTIEKDYGGYGSVSVNIFNGKSVLPMDYESSVVRGKKVFRWKYPWNRIYDGEPITHWRPLPEPPDKDNNVHAKTPNEPLTQADIDKMHFDRVWIDYGVDDSGERCGEEGVVLYGKLYDIDTLDGSAFEDLLLDACDGETLDRPSGDYKVYRHPPEEEKL